MHEKKTPALIFTPTSTHVTTWVGSPLIEGEIRRIEISRVMAAALLKDIRKRVRKLDK